MLFTIRIEIFIEGGSTGVFVGHTLLCGRVIFENGLFDNGSCGERDTTASGSGGVHQQLPVRETHR
jgi:hypothetical protein